MFRWNAKENTIFTLIEFFFKSSPKFSKVSLSESVLTGLVFGENRLVFDNNKKIDFILFDVVGSVFWLIFER